MGYGTRTYNRNARVAVNARTLEQITETPQDAPNLFTRGTLVKEVKYLIRCNTRFGSHILRTILYTRIMRYIADMDNPDISDEAALASFNESNGRAT